MSDLHAVVAQIKRDLEEAAERRAEQCRRAEEADKREREYWLASMLAAVAAVAGSLVCLACFIAVAVLG